LPEDAKIYVTTAATNKAQAAITVIPLFLYLFFMD
jgi:hypothetical protein